MFVHFLANDDQCWVWPMFGMPNMFRGACLSIFCGRCQGAGDGRVEIRAAAHSELNTTEATWSNRRPCNEDRPESPTAQNAPDGIARHGAERLKRLDTARRTIQRVECGDGGEALRRAKANFPGSMF